MADEAGKITSLGRMVLRQMEEIERINAELPEGLEADASTAVITLKDTEETWTITVKKGAEE